MKLYETTRISKPCGGLDRFAHNSFGSFDISGNSKQICHSLRRIEIKKKEKKKKKNRYQKFD